MRIREIASNEKEIIKQVVNIHLKTFNGFFLTFMGSGFLRQMYAAYAKYEKSGLLVAFDNNKPVAFLAYSTDMSGLYKYMVRHQLIPFALYSFCAFIRSPKIFMRLIRAFLKSSESKREESYVELASIGVEPGVKSKGIGSSLIEQLKKMIDFSVYKYITLETDAIDNEVANKFYVKNGFILYRKYETREKREMNEYRFSPDEIEKG